MNEKKLIETISKIDGDMWMLDQNQGHFHMRKTEIYIEVGPKMTILTREGKSTISVIHRLDHNKELYDKMFFKISNYFIVDGLKKLEESLK